MSHPAWCASAAYRASRHSTHSPRLLHRSVILVPVPVPSTCLPPAHSALIKTAAVKDKLEELCRELQNRMKLVKEESLKLTREDAAKRCGAGVVC